MGLGCLQRLTLFGYWFGWIYEFGYLVWILGFNFYCFIDWFWVVIAIDLDLLSTVRDISGLIRFCYLMSWLSWFCIVLIAVDYCGYLICCALLAFVMWFV